MPVRWVLLLAIGGWLTWRGGPGHGAFGYILAALAAISAAFLFMEEGFHGDAIYALCAVIAFVMIGIARDALPAR